MSNTANKTLSTCLYITTVVDAEHILGLGFSVCYQLPNHLDKLFADNPPQFEVLEIAGDESVAWSRWQWKRPQGNVEGVGLYKVQSGQFISYRDVFEVPEEI